MSHPVLYPYQRRYLADTARFKAGMWSRQTGKTFATTLEAVLDVLEAEAAGRFARVRRAKAEGKEEEAGRWSRSAYALKGALPDIRHAYAMTIHKSQGSTFDTVLVDWREAQKARMAGADLSRLLYVAITRASQHCVIVV